MTPERTAAQDSVIRLGLLMMAADVRSALTPVQRQWVIGVTKRTQALTAAQRAKLQGPLVAYIENFYPRILAIVQKQFDGL